MRCTQKRKLLGTRPIFIHLEGTFGTPYGSGLHPRLLWRASAQLFGLYDLVLWHWFLILMIFIFVVSIHKYKCMKVYALYCFWFFLLLIFLEYIFFFCIYYGLPNVLVQLLYFQYLNIISCRNDTSLHFFLLTEYFLRK